MKLLLLRHGEAEDRSPTGRDADRRLTAEGRERLARVARGVATLKERPDRAIASPYVRARETAEVMLEGLALGELTLETSEALVPGAPPSAILDELTAGGEDGETVLLVGHSPHLGLLLGHLVSGEGVLDLEMKKASLAGVEAGLGFREPGRLLFYLPPRALERMR